MLVRLSGALSVATLVVLCGSAGLYPTQSQRAVASHGALCLAPSVGKGISRYSSSGDLLYVSTGFKGVFILAYPSGQFVAQFETPQGNPNGVCADRHGSIYVSAVVAPFGYIYEYTHGGTEPIATLDDDNYPPASCAVDPTTGNLAVVNQDPGGSKLAIYQQAQGYPIYYSDLNVSRFQFCAYDNSGNLFVDGQAYSRTRSTLSELASGSGSFTEIALD